MRSHLHLKESSPLAITRGRACRREVVGVAGEATARSPRRPFTSPPPSAITPGWHEASIVNQHEVSTQILEPREGSSSSVLLVNGISP